MEGIVGIDGMKPATVMRNGLMRRDWLAADNGSLSSLESAGFTLVELLVVIAIIAILAAVLMPVLAAAKKKALQIQCLNNVKELGTGFILYVNDNNDIEPGCASGTDYGPHLEDWIYWRMTFPPPIVKGVIMTPNKSPILDYAGTGSAGTTNLLRCPMDRDDSWRDTQGAANEGAPYNFSYQLASYDLVSANTGPNPGPATIINSAGAAWRFKAQSIRNPAGKILVAEPPATVKSGDAPPVDTSWAAETGRWEPFNGSGAANNAGKLVNYLTCRHDGGANCGFADGHAQLVPWQFGTNSYNSLPSD